MNIYFTIRQEQQTEKEKKTCQFFVILPGGS